MKKEIRKVQIVMILFCAVCAAAVLLAAAALLQRNGETVAIAKAEKASDAVYPVKVIFIGDSRTVGMYWAVDTYGEDEVHATDEKGDTWSCKVGEGLSWMKSDGVPPIEDLVGENTAVVITMGVNDIVGGPGVSDYLSYINQKAGEWILKGAKVYYVSVNPVRSDPGNGLTNAMIGTWNRQMKEGLSERIGYIDTNSAVSGQIDFADDLHYENDTNIEIYNRIRASVQ